jgi:hypothetical protein
MNNEKEKEIIKFLNDIIISIENKNIQPDNLQQVGEFLMSYKYKQVDDYEYSDILKYVSIGYYIYNIIDTSK